MDLEDIRQKIDTIDHDLVSLLEKRMALVTAVSDYKQKVGKATFDSKRERVVLKQVSERVMNKVYEPYILNAFKDIMKESRAYQESRKNEN